MTHHQNNETKPLHIYVVDDQKIGFEEQLRFIGCGDRLSGPMKFLFIRTYQIKGISLISRTYRKADKKT